MSDDYRTIHGKTVEGYLIVRYERSGKWYIEPYTSWGLKRRRVSVIEAADEAAAGTHHPGKAGGSRFDLLVERDPADWDRP